ncbi:MAG: glycosyltransferase family 4 protein [Bacteroidota bacterium]
MNNNKRAVIGIPVLHNGGTEMHTLLLSRVLMSQEYDVTVCCYHEYDSEIVRQFTDLGIQVRLLKVFRSLHGMSFSELRTVYTSFSRLLTQIHPQLIHIQYVAPGFVPILAAARMSSATVTAGVHTSGKYLYGRKAKFMINAAARLCDAFVCVSNDVRMFWFGAHAGDTIRTIYNGVDTVELGKSVKGLEKEKIKREYSIGHSPLFAIVGRAGRHKGHDLLFRAFARVAEHVPEAGIVIIGEQVEKEFLVDLADELHIASKLSWSGPLPHTALAHVLASSDCLVIPSRYEGFGLAAIEAMALGVPVIGSAVGGLPEIIEHEKTGLLFQPEDTTSLYEAMVRMIRDTNLRERCINGGKKAVAEKFSFERFRLEWIDLLMNVCDKRQTPNK